MKRIFALTLAILFTIFTLPVNGWTAIAEENNYNDIKDGTYNITAKAMHESEDKASGAQSFINKDAKLSVQDGNAKLTISAPHNDMASIDGIQIEGKEAEIEKKDNITNHTFTLPNIKENLNSRVQYSVPSMGIEHDVPFRFILEGLNELPVKEKESNDEQLIIKNPEKTEEVEYKSEIDLSRYFNNPAKLIEKNGKKYIQMTGNMGQYIDSLVVNGKKAALSKVKEDGTYIMQFEINKKLTEKLDFKMVIDTGQQIMEHDTKLWFEDETSVKPNTEVKDETTDESNIEVKEEKATESIEFKTIEKKDSSLEKNKTKVIQKGNKGLKEVVYEVTLTNGKETDRKAIKETINKKPVDEIVAIGTKSKEEKIKDGTYDIIAKAMHETEDKASGAARFINEKAQLIVKDKKFKLKISVPKNDLATIDGIQIEDNDGKINRENGLTYYTFNLDILKQELPSQVQYSVPSMEMKHDVPFRFVLEGLDKLPIEVQNVMNINEEDTSGDNPEDDKGKPKNNDNNKKIDNQKTETSNLVPDKAYTINYTIKHEDGVKTSVADEFFKKPGKLLEKDGVLYAQFTIKNGNMVKQLSTEFGDALIVKKNKDGSIVVQFKVNKDLSNMKLSMLIDVPGLYTETHEAILVFDKNSKKEIDASKEKLVASSSDNGPTVKGGIEGKGLGNGGSKDNKDALTNLSNGGPDKPEFGSNSNGGLNDKGKSTNPQTGDLTNIWLYAFLLAASLLILGVKFRRRTI